MTGERPRRGIVLHPRLQIAGELLSGSRVIADIGCDHGRLCCALLQRDQTLRCIASDVSAPSLQKAETLGRRVGVSDRLLLRCGDGLSVLNNGEADAVALLGMGGTLMVQLLSACETPLMGAKKLVVQPMRAEADIRRYLYENGYHIEDDRVVEDAGRLYQVFSARPGVSGARDAWPPDFPPDCFTVGYRAYLRREPLLAALVRRNLDQCLLRLAAARGTEGQVRLEKKAVQMQTILRHLEEDGYETE